MSEITEARLQRIAGRVKRDHMRWSSARIKLVKEDVSALIAEVRRLRLLAGYFDNVSAMAISRVRELESTDE